MSDKIKAGELRLQNLVNCYNILALQIISIDKDFVMCEGQTGRFLISDLEGIPLTPEWLVKMGFENRNDDLHDFYKDLPNNTTLLISDKGRCPVLIEDYYNCPHLAIQLSGRLILYVHQLQNLTTFLTGEELKINI